MMRFQDHQCFDSEGSTVTFVLVLLHTDAILMVVYLSNDLNSWCCMGFFFFGFLPLLASLSFVAFAFQAGRGCCVYCSYCFSSGEGVLCIWCSYCCN